MTCMKLKLCSIDINIWACYLFFACFTFPEEKNFLTTTLAHYTNAQPLPAATAVFLCDCVLNIESQHNMHNGRTNIQSMHSCKFDTQRGIVSCIKILKCI